MPRTLADWRSVVTHALDGAPAVIVTDADTTADLIINDAAEMLMAERSWNFNLRPVASLNLTNGQSYVACPSDFGEMVSLTYNGTGSKVQVVTLEQLDQLRADGGTDTSVLYCALSQPGQSSVTTAITVPRIEVTPTPAASVTGALLLRYRSAWTLLDTNTDVANLPVWMEPVFESLIRAVAKGREDGDLEPRVASVFGGRQFAAAVKRDAQSMAAAVAPQFPIVLGLPATVTPTRRIAAVLDPS